MMDSNPERHDEIIHRILPEDLEAVLRGMDDTTEELRVLELFRDNTDFFMSVRDKLAETTSDPEVINKMLQASAFTLMAYQRRSQIDALNSQWDK